MEGPAKLPTSALPSAQRPSSLPKPLTSMVGREAEVTLAKQLLQHESVRLLTMIGPGGVGKTRLCIHIAQALDGEYDEIVFVDFSTVLEPAGVTETIARSMGVVEVATTSVLQRISNVAIGRRILLILDNLEQIVGVGLELSRLLEVAPTVAILATSRVPLHVSVEQEFPVEPFESGDAVSLFANRARLVRPAFEIDEENLEIVAEICHHLDGLPLAIELAAARVKMLTLPSILSRVEESTALLSGGPLDAPERQQTLRSTILWSYNLLDQDMQWFIRRLSVFAGGFDLEAAEAILTDTGSPSREVFEGVSTLVENSLLRSFRSGIDQSGATRFAMLETIQRFARDELEKSGDAREAQGNHAEWCLEFAQVAGRQIEGHSAVRWAGRIDEELPNFRIALDWFLGENLANEALKLASELWLYWMLRGQTIEGREWLDQAIELSNADPRFSVRAVAVGGFLASNQGDYAYANQLEESLQTARSLNDIAGEAMVLMALGDMAGDQNNHLHAIELLESALELFNQIGDRTRIVMTLANLGAAASRLGDTERAVTYLEDGIYLAREQGFGLALCYLTNLLSRVLKREKKLQEAATLYRESVENAWALQERAALAYVLLEGGAIAAEAGNMQRAVHIWGAVEALRQSIGYALAPSVAHATGVDYDRLMSLAAQQLGSDGFDEAWKFGRALPLSEAVQEALSFESKDLVSEEFEQPTQWDLTSRELAVLKLLVEGKTDRQIGEELFISHRTAEGHVARILAKLDVANRSAAVALASRSGLGTIVEARPA